MITLIAAVALLAADPDAGVDAIAQDLLDATGSPGAAVARLCGGRLEEGVAGVRIAGREAPVEPGDLWHMGSNTKAMTATLAARLVEQGAIDWSTTLGESLAGLDLDIAESLRDATLEALLSHRSGMMANAGPVTAVRLSGADADRDVRADRLVYARAVLAEPGGPRGEFLYSNAGYVIAAMMLEQAAGLGYEALMAREVFAPLGMDGAGWGPPGVRGEADQPRGHRSGLFGGFGPREPGGGADNPPAMNPAGRAHLPLVDLLDFLIAHRDQPESYLGAHSWARLHTPPEGGNYALGWGVTQDGSLLHAGSNTMWFARMRVDAESGCALAAAVNDGRSDIVSGPVNDALESLAGRAER
ncbi:MAG: beta-lactamase family protein [Alphaproteobacteria bacterium]|nr:beta-lactamase family protein [Alphaproteobacteria bacterium]